jgi:hypothetical protein
MQFTTSIIALALAASSVTASDVYATFYSPQGQINPNFDIANPGCFSIDSAVKLSVNQYARGPYCLSAWTAGGCSGEPFAKETFQYLNTGTQYSLSEDVAEQGSYRWDASGAC